MIFKQWEQVLDGTKTQTRRPVKPNECLWDDAETGLPYAITQVNTDENKTKYRVGDTLAVQRPDNEIVGRIQITKIRRERLGDISEEDCLAEGLIIGNELEGVCGYTCPICGTGWYAPAFVVYACLWNHCYGPGAWERMKDDDCWVLEFEVDEGG